MAAIEKRKSARDGIVYRAKVRVKGHPSQTRTFRRLTDAKNWVQQTESALRDGRNVTQISKRKHTVSELIERYIKTQLPQKSTSTQEAQLRHFAWWKKQLGTRYLNSITPAALIECRDKLATMKTRTGDTLSRSTCNRYMSALGHALTIAWKEWQWIDENPMVRISKLRESSGIVRYLDEDEQTRLLVACKASSSPYLYLITLLGLSTGMRVSEIKSLTWQQLDLKNGKIILLTTKNKQLRQVPIQGKALQELKEHAKIRRIDTDLLFPGILNPQKPFCIRHAWETARKKANIKNFRFHDLRHTAASYYAMSGATARDLCEIFGWKTMQMAMRYAHLSDSHTGELAAKMSEKFIVG